MKRVVLSLLLVCCHLSGCASDSSSPETRQSTVVDVQPRVVDVQPPAVSFGLFPTVTHKATMTISGTVENGASVAVKTAAMTEAAPATITGTSWTYTVKDLVVGDNVISATAQDAAGNKTGIETRISRKELEIIAHRGASKIAPENTLAAFNLAWQQGADAIEFDVSLSLDHRVMVIHDASTGRTAGTDYVVKNTSSDILRTLDVGSYRGTSYAGEKIPYLEEVLATIPRGKRAIIDVKTGAEILPFLQEGIVESGKASQVVITSYDAKVLEGVHNSLPFVPTLLLVNNNSLTAADIRQRVVGNGYDGVNIYYTAVTQELVTLMHDSGKEVFCWTVDDPSVAVTLKGFRVDGILSNRLDALLAALNPA